MNLEISCILDRTYTQAEMIQFPQANKPSFNSGWQWCFCMTKLTKILPLNVISTLTQSFRLYQDFLRSRHLDLVASFLKVVTIAPAFRRIALNLVGQRFDTKAHSLHFLLDLCRFLGSIVQKCIDKEAHPTLCAVLWSLPAHWEHVHMRPFIPKYTYASLINSPFIFLFHFVHVFMFTCGCVKLKLH